MTARPVVLRTLANRDIDEVISYYLAEGSPPAVLGFIDALEPAYAHIGVHPVTGSSRCTHELNLPDLRYWPLSGYPRLVFYVEHPNHFDVWRVLHGQRDSPNWMQQPENL